MPINFFDFNAIRLKVASPENILSWSSGEVTKPETINYRTQKPERDGLFCEKIFGPIKDWECACGKYKRIRYKGIVCDKCGVEVTKSVIRREKMGHIKLVTPVTHIWFLRGVPSKIGLILDMSIQNLEKVVYFAGFIVTEIKEEIKKDILKQIEDEFKAAFSKLELEFNEQTNQIKQKIFQELNIKKDEKINPKIKKKLVEGIEIYKQTYEEKLKKLKNALKITLEEINSIKLTKILSKNEYQDLSLKYGHIFEVGIGAEAIYKLLSKIDLEKLAIVLEKEIIINKTLKKEKMIRRLKLIKNLINNKIKPEWMTLTVVPILPPDLRPMVQLDGGRFASSDLNDLYRRIINRNNRLKRLIELNAPEVICRNEKRMLQEVVDNLIDNSIRHSKTVVASTGQKRSLKSISDMLKGKQGRFRQNLLGKRVDYSGRSVIVVGPHLKLDQCGIPKTMALELFKPFVISQLIKQGYVHNIRSAGYLIEEGRKEVWDILENITNKSFVLLNRAPTLHRLGIQAFKPILIEGKAIQIHPMVCAAFNADFDGDQMAVHVPLTLEAQKEAKEIMLSTKNLLKPSTGDPITTPTQDMIVGAFYLTYIKKEDREKHLTKEIKIFTSKNEALLAYDLKKISLQEIIKVRTEKGIIKATPGKIIFNSVLPTELKDYETVFDKKMLVQLIKKCHLILREEKTAIILDKIKEITLKHLTQAGFSWGMSELPDLPQKYKIINLAEEKVDEIQNQYDEALLTQEERYNKIIEIWTETKDKIIQLCKGILDEGSSAFYMIESGARGSITQITQMMGMKGLVVNPKGEIIELPIKSSFKEGFDVLEYFISSHGARKGLSDTALRTSSAGYLTRRLADVAQGVITTEEDCKDKEGFVLFKEMNEKIGEPLIKRILGRVILENIIDPKTKKILIKKGELISFEKFKLIEKLDLKQIKIRSTLSCKSLSGICQKCYGWDLGYNRLVNLGVAVGVIAAQSIGEPGTQLTMRTFHTGGVAGRDITQGLPRVEEIFEARSTKRKAIISEVDGKIIEIEEDKNKKVLIKCEGTSEDSYKIKDIREQQILVKEGQKIKKGDIILKQGKKKKEIIALRSGQIKILKNEIKIIFSEEKIKEYLIPSGYILKVKENELVTMGDALTEGNLDLEELFRFKGRQAVQKYILEEIQYIYSSQGQKVSDKHLEIIIRQMFSRVFVQDPGGSEFLKGEIISKLFFTKINKKLLEEKKPLIKVKELFLGITRVSLLTESFLSAASFQETARVLIDAAITGHVDELKGLKENVIIGRLIPVGTGFKDLRI
ncbi:MAG: DNA-directed RNA polymerase subunit beta' [Candidatus Kuenenbacteria bacterium]